MKIILLFWAITGISFAEDLAKRDPAIRYKENISKAVQAYMIQQCELVSDQYDCFKKVQEYLKNFVNQIKREKIITTLRSDYGLLNLSINPYLEEAKLPLLEPDQLAEGGWNFEDDLVNVHLSILNACIEALFQLRIQKLEHYRPETWVNGMQRIFAEVELVLNQSFMSSRLRMKIGPDPRKSK